MVKRKRQTTQWSKEKDKQHNGQKQTTDNTKVKSKRQQHNGQKKKTDNTMVKRKRQTVFDIRILITPLVSSNSSSYEMHATNLLICAY
jgi:hypothetical protein